MEIIYINNLMRPAGEILRKELLLFEMTQKFDF